jgi:hypothetical protein
MGLNTSLTVPLMAKTRADSAAMTSRAEHASLRNSSVGFEENAILGAS